MAKEIVIYGAMFSGGSTSVQPIALDEEGKVKMMMFALSNSGTSTSVQPVILDADGQIYRSS